MRPRICLGCRRTFEPAARTERRCDVCRHRHTSSVEANRERSEPWRAVYDLDAWAKTRARVLLRDGQCRALVMGGGRCAITDALQVHHVTPLAELYRRARSSDEFLALALNERNLAALCPAHHAQADATRREADKRRRLVGEA